MHLVLQKMDLRQEYDEKKVKELIDNLVKAKIIIEKEAKAIDVKKIVDFTKTDFAKRISRAKEIQKERPFYINIKASELFDEELDEQILVQGIIDLYFIDDAGKLVLVDYKTDSIKEEKELISKYTKQLQIYKIALETAMKKNVDEVYIYSLILNKPIQI